MIIPSKSGLAVLGLSLCLYVVSMQSTSGLLFLLLGIFFGCFIINCTRARRSVLGVKIVPPGTIYASEGDRLEGAWKVENLRNSPIGLIELQSEWGCILRIQALEPYEARNVTSDLKFPCRGVYPFHEFKVDSTYPFGLVRFRRRLAWEGEIIVFPKVYACQAPEASGFEPMLGGRFTGKYTSRTGDNFHGVRPMLPQDPVKLIHWPSSSKGLGLMIKEFDQELSGKVSIIFGCDTNTDRRSDPRSIHAAARAAGSLVLSALDIGYQVEFATLSDSEVLFIPPFSDGDVTLETLARAMPSPKVFTSKRIENTISKVSRNSALCFVLTGINEEVSSCLTKFSNLGLRKVTVYLPVKLNSDILKPSAGVVVRRFSEMRLETMRAINEFS